MNKQPYLLLFALLFLICACRKDDGNSFDASIDFKPRYFTNICINPGEKNIINFDNVTHYEYTDLKDNTVVPFNKFFLSIITSNFNLSTLINRDWPSIYFPFEILNDKLDNHNLELESQIIIDYKLSLEKNTKSGNYASNIISMEYRLTPIKNIIITSNSVLFGKNSGEILNDYFKIVNYVPHFIISSQINRLIYGFSDVLPTSIDEWLALSPMAQPAMYLELKSAPPELPQTVQFTVEMETDTGAKLSYTSFPVTLTR